jgi:precorrin-3B synthase
VPFGRAEARVLAEAATSARGLRITPWRIFLFEDAQIAPIEGLLDTAGDPLLRADACPGAPDCPQATVETRELARYLASFVRGSLHISGCDKACARSRAADVTVTGRAGLYDLALKTASVVPALRRAELLAHFERRSDAPRL